MGYYSYYNRRKKKKLNKYYIIIPSILLSLVLATIAAVAFLPKNKLQSAERTYYKGNYPAALEKFKALAQANNIEAQVYLGTMYFEGKGVDVNHTAAAELFNRAAEKNHPRAMHYLATCYITGLGVQRDINKALQLEIAAAVNKQNISKVSIRQSTIAGQDFEEEIKSQQVKTRNIMHGNLEENGQAGGPPSKARLLLESFLADTGKGRAEAAYLMGLVYSDGEEAKPNMREAEKWFRKAANEGNISAQTALGMMYFLGDGVLQDFTESAHWFNKAAEKGSKDAQFMLGNMYSTGIGVEADPAKAATLYAMAIANQHSLAKCYLAELFSKGYGVYENKDMARILCQEGFKETGEAICYDIWDINQLGKTNRNTPDLF